jgi:hypothetical protein
MIKKKIKFKKEIATPKTPRFNKYIQRAVEKNSLKIRKPDSHTITLSNFTPVTILKLKAKETAAFTMPKIIYSSLLTGGNKRILTKTYIITPRRLKNKIKAKINIEKLLKIIIST